MADVKLTPQTSQQLFRLLDTDRKLLLFPFDFACSSLLHAVIMVLKCHALTVFRCKNTECNMQHSRDYFLLYPFLLHHMFSSHSFHSPLEHLLLMINVWTDMFFFFLLYAKNVFQLSLVTAFVLFCRPARVTCHTTNTFSEKLFASLFKTTKLHQKAALRNRLSMSWLVHIATVACLGLSQLIPCNTKRFLIKSVIPCEVCSVIYTALL